MAFTLPFNAEVHVTVLLRNQALRQQSLLLFACTFLVFGVYYELATGRIISSDHLASTALALLKLPGIVVNVLIITYAGRRRTLAFSMIALAVVAGALATAHAVRAHSHVLAGIVVLWMLVFELCLLALFILPAELYPTVVRGAGVSLCYCSGRTGAFLAMFLSQIGSTDMKGLLYAVEAVLLLFFGVMALALPETTELQPANTMRDLATEKWHLQSPLRIARGGGKRKRPKRVEPDNRDGNRAVSTLAAGSENDAQGLGSGGSY